MSEQLAEDVEKWWNIWHRSFLNKEEYEEDHFKQATMYSFLYIIRKLKESK